MIAEAHLDPDSIFAGVQRFAQERPECLSRQRSLLDALGRGTPSETWSIPGAGLPRRGFVSLSLGNILDGEIRDTLGLTQIEYIHILIMWRPRCISRQIC